MGQRRTSFFINSLPNSSFSIAIILDLPKLSSSLSTDDDKET